MFRVQHMFESLVIACLLELGNFIAAELVHVGLSNLPKNNNRGGGAEL